MKHDLSHQPGEREVRVRFRFVDWLGPNGQSVYRTPEGVALALGDFHSGTVFEGTLAVDDPAELREALAKGFQPVFAVFAAPGDTKEIQ